jgi:hypothetical protein
VMQRTTRDPVREGRLELPRPLGHRTPRLLAIRADLRTTSRLVSFRFVLCPRVSSPREQAVSKQSRREGSPWSRPSRRDHLNLSAYGMVEAMNSAIPIVGRFVLARGIVGKMDASATTRFVAPWTRPVESTTAQGSSERPARQVPTGCQ